MDRNNDGKLQKSEVDRNANSRARRETTGSRAARTVPEEPAHRVLRDVPYHEVDGGDQKLLSLDLYLPSNDAAKTGRPVLIMIHGGGWRRSDKANPAVVGAKMRHFVGVGYVFASIKIGPVFSRSLVRADVLAQAIDTVDLDHGQINTNVGMIGDPMNRLIMRLHRGEDATKFPSVLPCKEPVNEPRRSSTEMPVTGGITFHESFVAGIRDVNGNFMGGTEMMRLVAHQAKLFAATRY
ncbi:MAG: hypothetical protein AAFN70_08910 [Planctomycetota bacterium]